MDKLLK